MATGVVSIASQIVGFAPTLQFAGLGTVMIGCMLHLAIIPLIFCRLTFVRLSSQDLRRPAGSRLLRRLRRSLRVAAVPLAPDRPGRACPPRRRRAV
jgi:hypothetical protein